MAHVFGVLSNDLPVSLPVLIIRYWYTTMQYPNALSVRHYCRQCNLVDFVFWFISSSNTSRVESSQLSACLNNLDDQRSFRPKEAPTILVLL